MTITLKHAPHFHSQNSLFFLKLTKHTILPSPKKPALRSTPAKWSMITQLFLTQPRIIVLRINNDLASSSNISTTQNLINNQVSEAPDSLSGNLENESTVIDNLVEAQALQHSTSFEIIFAILDSNPKDEYQHFVEESNNDKDELIT